MIFRSDHLCGFVLLGLVLLYLAGARGFTTGFIADPIGPKGFPYVLGAAALLLCLWLVARPGDEAEWPQRSFWVKYGSVAALLFAYALLLDPLGFIIATTLLITLLALFLGAKPAMALMFGVVFSTLLHILFRFLSVPLPGGYFYRALWAATG